MTTDARHRVDRDDLLARVNLTHVLDSLTSGVGDGPRRRWRCPEPSHPDQHPSATVACDRHGTERWRCWSGGHGGIAIDAVIAAKQLGIGESIGWLNDHYAHLQPIQPDTPSPSPSPIGQTSPPVIEYVERCEQSLRTRTGAEVGSWLHKRGLDDEILAANRVGADPGHRLLPRQRGLPTGHPAAVFPALDRYGNITYFQARFLNPESAGQKYGNPTRRLAANPGLSWGQPVGVAGRDLPLVATEGIPDSLIAARAGMRSVALLGSTASIQHVARELIHALDDGNAPRSVAVCFDADEAGRDGAARLIDRLESSGIDAVNVEPPDGMDITDWASINPHWTDQVVDAAQVGNAGRIRHLEMEIEL